MIKAIEYYEDMLHIPNPSRNTINKWVDMLPLVFYRANNEQKGYTAEEIGHPIISMPTKLVSGHRQTSDYLCYLPRYNILTPIFWERKSKEDWYSTLIHNRDMFLKECQRSCDDPDCAVMFVGVECLEKTWLKYRPVGKKGASLQSRYALTNAISDRFEWRVIIRWHQNRIAAVADMVERNKAWCRYNYEKILNLETIE